MSKEIILNLWEIYSEFMVNIYQLLTICKKSRANLEDPCHKFEEQNQIDLKIKGL
jgi:hypothetical protein